MSFEISEAPIVFKIDVVHCDTLSNQALLAKIQAEEKVFYPAGKA